MDGYVRACLVPLLALPRSRARQLKLANGGISVVARAAGLTRVLSLDDRSHLRQFPT
jgi:hypothetical protein